MPFKVSAERCDQCLFSGERIVSGKRMATVLKDCRRADTHFVCHKFSMDDPKSQVCCRGFMETQPPTNLMRIAQRLGAVVAVPLPVPQDREGTERTTSLPDSSKESVT